MTVAAAVRQSETSDTVEATAAAVASVAAETRLNAASSRVG